jgi:Protein of unknown function VcgC/VcgE (DUF2780)
MAGQLHALKEDPMKRIALVCLVAFGFAALVLAADDSSLVQTLARQLKITDDQAAGGAGAIFNYAKGALPTDDYGKVEKAVPEAAELAKKAPAPDSTTSTVKGALGKAGGSATGLSSLGSSFQKLGLSPDMVGKFTPIVVDYVDKKGGSQVGDIVRKVLTPEKSTTKE